MKVSATPLVNIYVWAVANKNLIYANSVKCVGLDINCFML